MPAPSSAQTGSTPTSAPATPAILIEDTLVSPQDVGDYSGPSQRGLLPPGPDAPPLPVDAPLRPATACGIARSGDTTVGSAAACELEGADIAAQQSAWDAYFARDSVTVGQVAFNVVERLEHDGWQGWHIATADPELNYQDAVLLRRLHGNRSYEVYVWADAESVRSMATSLASAQDAHLAQLGVQPDTPLAGFVNQAERLTVNDVALPWAQYASLVGLPVTDWSSDYQHGRALTDLTLHLKQESGYRQVDFEGGSLRIEATRWDDAGTATRSATLPSLGTDPRRAAVAHGDRSYLVTVTGALPGADDGTLAQRTIAALDEYLAGLDLAAPPADDARSGMLPAVGAAVPLDELLPLAATLNNAPGGMVETWQQAMSTGAGDANDATWTLGYIGSSGVPGNGRVTGGYTLVAAGLTDGFDAPDFQLSLDDHRSSPASDGSQPGADGWSANGEFRFVRTYGELQAELVMLRRSGTTEEWLTRLAPELAAIDAHLAALAGTAASPGNEPQAEADAWERMRRLAASPQSLPIDTGSGRESLSGLGAQNWIAVGRPTASSPAGVVAHWETLYGLTDFYPANGRRSVMVFADAAAASGYVAERTAGQPVEPINGTPGGLFRSGETAVFITQRDRLVFEMTNEWGLAGFNDVPLDASTRLRLAAFDWNDEIYLASPL